MKETGLLPPVLRMSGIRKTYGATRALDGVTFELLPGDVRALLGENGAGKSTLVKILSGAVKPDSGAMLVDDAVYSPASPLDGRRRGISMIYQELTLAPHLTVEENILVYGSIMGLKNSEVKKRMEPILKFSGVERFRDAKLKNLSSGMQMRLGFSVAIETNPDVFLIDEALTVGDIDFQQKCIDKFKQFKAEKKTIILVSHALGLVEDFCEKTVLLSKGEMAGFGPTAYVVDQYQGLARGS